MSDIVSMTAICNLCGKELRPARAFWDGEPTYVGYFPCACNRPIMTDCGVVYPGEEEHDSLLESGRYSINDLREPDRAGNK